MQPTANNVPVQSGGTEKEEEGPRYHVMRRTPLDPRVVQYYLDKLKKSKVALTGLQLLERAQKLGLTFAPGGKEQTGEEGAPL